MFYVYLLRSGKTGRGYVGSMPYCVLIRDQISFGHEKIRLPHLWPAHYCACLLHLLRMPNEWYRGFWRDGFYGCTEQKCWSPDHPESRQLWRQLGPQCVDRWCVSSFTCDGSILPWHLVTRAACHIPHRDAESWRIQGNDKASHGASGPDI